MELIKTSDIGGNSFHGHTISASKRELVKLFGNPNYFCADIDEKVQNEWDFNFVKKDNRHCSISIYDWKEYRLYLDDTVIEWHIGAENELDSLEACRYINSLL